MRIIKVLLLLLFAGAYFAQGGFNAYYTKLNSGESWEADFRMGEHADIVVQMKDVGKFYFWRASSYLPIWETEAAANYVSQAPFTFSGDGEGLRWDKLCRHSYIRLISSDNSEAVIHWRYAPKFDDISDPESQTGQAGLMNIIR